MGIGASFICADPGEQHLSISDQIQAEDERNAPQGVCMRASSPSSALSSSTQESFTVEKK